jgi:hypothetical protein
VSVVCDYLILKFVRTAVLPLRSDVINIFPELPALQNDDLPPRAEHNDVINPSATLPPSVNDDVIDPSCILPNSVNDDVINSSAAFPRSVNDDVISRCTTRKQGQMF